MKQKHQGGSNIPKLECTNHRIGRWAVRWGFEQVSSEEEDGVRFFEQVIDHKPTLIEVKDIVLSSMNEDIDEQVVSGFTWNDMEVWLSTENQFNYKAAFDLAVQTNGASLPVTFKFGTTETPVYYTFEQLSDLQDFFVKAMKHVQDVLADGWRAKDAVDWAEYSQLL